VSGLHYQLEYKNNLSDPQWLSLAAAAAGTGAPISLSDTNPPPASRFYRVRCY
jgi:hypothetical protein